MKPLPRNKASGRLAGMRIGIVGDWHGNELWAERAILALAETDVIEIWHLGDLGLGFGREVQAQRYVNFLAQVLKKANLKMWVVLGNHEDYDWIERQPISADGIRWLGDCIGVVPRGYQFQRGSRHFLAVSGASSIDFKQRTLSVDWWLQENITEEQADNIIKEVVAGSIDVMLCHDAPTGVPTIDLLSLQGGWDRSEMHYAEHSRRQLNRIFHHVMPTQLWHGHWHHRVHEKVKFDGFETEIVGLNKEFSVHNVAVFDTTDLSFEYIPVLEIRD